MSDIKFAVMDKTASVGESFFKDLMTGSMCAFCVYVSQGSTFWTFVTGLMFMAFMFSKIAVAMKRYSTFKTKAELVEWANGLPE